MESSDYWCKVKSALIFLIWPILEARAEILTIILLLFWALFWDYLTFTNCTCTKKIQNKNHVRLYQKTKVLLLLLPLLWLTFIVWHWLWSFNLLHSKINQNNIIVLQIHPCLERIKLQERIKNLQKKFILSFNF